MSVLSTAFTETSPNVKFPAKLYNFVANKLKTVVFKYYILVINCL